MIQPITVMAASPAPAPTPLLRVFVPGSPPSGNHMYQKRKQATVHIDALGRRYKPDRVLTPAALQWRRDVAQSVERWRFAESAPRPNLAVSFTWVGILSDIDNPVKLTLDGVKIGLAVDDRYVTELVLRKQRKTADMERGAWIEVMCLPQLPKKAQQVQPRARKPRNKGITKGVTGISDGRSTAGK